MIEVDEPTCYKAVNTNTQSQQENDEESGCTSNNNETTSMIDKYQMNMDFENDECEVSQSPSQSDEDDEDHQKDSASDGVLHFEITEPISSDTFCTQGGKDPIPENSDLLSTFKKRKRQTADNEKAVSSSVCMEKRYRSRKQQNSSSEAVQETLPSYRGQEFQKSPIQDSEETDCSSEPETIFKVTGSPRRVSRSSNRKINSFQKSTSIEDLPCLPYTVSIKNEGNAPDLTDQYFCPICDTASQLSSQKALCEHIKKNHTELVEEFDNKDISSHSEGQDEYLNVITEKKERRLKQRAAKKPVVKNSKITLADLTCSVCEKQFTSKKKLKQHSETHRSTKDFECDVCGKFFQTHDSLYHHKRGLHSTDKQYKCETCDRAFNFRNSYELHMLKHTGERPYKCTECEKSYLRSGHLKEHMEASHNMVKRFKCDECDREFSYSNTLKLHKMRHNGSKPFMCAICGESFLHSSALKYHKEAHHGDGKTFQCDVCEKVYKTEHLMKTHRRRHTSDVCRFMCNICGRQFMFKCDLDAHINSHGDEKKYVCGICADTFKTYSSLYTHQNVHKTEKPFTCMECGKAFKTKESCKAHEKRHNGEKSYACEICGNFFSEKGGLTKHRKTVHTKLNLFGCPICGKTSARMDNLRVHMRVHEKECGTSLSIIRLSESSEHLLNDSMEPQL